MTDPLAELSLNTYKIASIADKQAADICEPVSSILVSHQKTIFSIIEKEGFQNIHAGRKSWLPLHQRKNSGKPQLQVTRQGTRAWICFPETAPSLFDLRGIESDQYAYAEKNITSEDLYYAAFYYEHDGSERVLVMCGFKKIRSSGQWLENSTAEQFLPFSTRNGFDRYAPLLGEAAMFKIGNLIRIICADGTTLSPFIRGLVEPHKNDKTALKALAVIKPPTITVLLRFHHEEKMELIRPFFYSDQDPSSVLELVSISPSEDEGELVTLMDKTGRTFHAECLEAILLRSVLKPGQRFQWTLSMVAESCRNNSSCFAVTSGPLFELAKEEYRKEHGCEPPSDFDIKVSTDKMRLLNTEEDAYAMAVGIIEEINRVELGFSQLTVLRVLCMPENDDIHLNIFVNNLTLGDFTPEIGGNIACQGYLYAAPDTLLPAETSWQDSGAVARQVEERDSYSRAFFACRRYEKYSIAMGVIAGALEQSGWEICDDSLHNWTRNYPTFIATRQDGTKAIFVVDTIIDGHEPDFPYTEEMIEYWKNAGQQHWGTETECYHCQVSLNYHETTQHYALAMKIEPEFPEDLSIQIWAAPASPTKQPPSTPIGEQEEQRQYPETIDEQFAAELFCEAVRTQDWPILAPWLREELDYTSHTVQCRYKGKIDFIRYMAERKLMWEKNGHWKNMHFETGSILLHGKRRPCCMSFCGEEKTAAVVFGNSNGLIGTIEVTPKETYESYIPKIHNDPRQV